MKSSCMLFFCPPYHIYNIFPKKSIIRHNFTMHTSVLHHEFFWVYISPKNGSVVKMILEIDRKNPLGWSYWTWCFLWDIRQPIRETFSGTPCTWSTSRLMWVLKNRKVRSETWSKIPKVALVKHFFTWNTNATLIFAGLNVITPLIIFSSNDLIHFC